MEKYRVFISYSHTNLDDVLQLAEILRQIGLMPLYDANIQPGTSFDDSIRKYIAHSHVFMPFITRESSEKGWVHQEIGYAMALNIPVLPVSREELPEAMIDRLHAITLDENLSNAREKLDYAVFRNLVEGCTPEMSTYWCTEQPPERAVMMARMADDVRSMGYTGMLRQKGGISSFQIPDRPISHRIWTQRYHTVLKNDYHCKCQLGERKALEAHARANGCRLIINPTIITRLYSPIAQRARLSTLLDFLCSMKDCDIDVAFDDQLTFNESVTLVGDWFSAESYFRSETQGFMQTMFTRHAPGIRDKIDIFDSEFFSLLEINGTRSGRTLQPAIDIIREYIDRIE